MTNSTTPHDGRTTDIDHRDVHLETSHRLDVKLDQSRGPDYHQAAGHHQQGSPAGDHQGHDGHGDHVSMFRRLFWVMLAVGLPVVVFSPMFAIIVGYQLPAAGWVGWVSPVLGTAMYLWGGRPFLTGAVAEIRAKSPGMTLLVALAITVAFLSSLGASLGLLSHQLDFWWELALLIVIMLLGHWIEMRSLAQSASALESLAALLPTRRSGSRTARASESTRPTCGSVTWSSSAPAPGFLLTEGSSPAPRTWMSR